MKTPLEQYNYAPVQTGLILFLCTVVGSFAVSSWLYGGEAWQRLFVGTLYALYQTILHVVSRTPIPDLENAVSFVFFFAIFVTLVSALALFELLVSIYRWWSPPSTEHTKQA